MIRLKPNGRSLLVFIHDGVSVAVAWYIAFLLRFNFDIPSIYLQSLREALPLIILTALCIFWLFGLYRGIWRYASLPELKRIPFAAFIATVSVPVMQILLQMTPLWPRSTLLLAPLLLIIIMSGSRITYRVFKERSLYRLTHITGDPVLILGTGDMSRLLVKDLQRTLEWRVVGILVDTPEKVGRVIQGVPVLGCLEEVAHWSNRLDAHCAIIDMPSTSRTERIRIIDICSAANIRMFTLPWPEDVVLSRASTSEVRLVEGEDMLRPEQVEIDSSSLTSFLTGQVVMVTGAGGTVGSELCRQIAQYSPAMLVLFEVNEAALGKIKTELSWAFGDLPMIAIVGNIRDRVRVKNVLRKYHPSVVYHAAAYKHVSLMEEVNVWEAIRNNVLGTYHIAESAIAHGVKTFVMVSTSISESPTSVIDATHRLAEMVCQKLQGDAETRFEIVRFDKVLGGTGNVIPLFQRQISSGGPVTVTHPDITRCVISLPEVAKILLQAGVMGQSGEILEIDRGEPVKITDLARMLIRLSGFTEEDIKIVYVGLRPGEMLYEKSLRDDDTQATDHPKLRIVRARAVDDLNIVELLRWLKNRGTPSDDEARRDLKHWVPEYTPAQRPQLRETSSATAATVGLARTKQSIRIELKPDLRAERYSSTNANVSNDSGEQSRLDGQEQSEIPEIAERSISISPNITVTNAQPTEDSSLGVRALVMKGGGVKGLALAGAIIELEKHFKFDVFVGTSAGAIAAVLLAAGVTANELEGILKNKDFTDFLDKSRISQLKNLLMRRGIHTGASLEEWISELLKEKISKQQRVDMQDLPRRAIIYASNEEKGTVTFDSKGENLDAPAAFAARCSISIPYFFVPHEHHGIPIFDGGLLNNFPVGIFLDKFPKHDFLGIYLSTGEPSGKPRKSIIGMLINIITGRDEQVLVDKYTDKIIVIDPSPIRTYQFYLSTIEKDFLIYQGRLAALRFLLKLNTTKELFDQFDICSKREKVLREQIMQSRWRARENRRFKYGLIFFLCLFLVISSYFLDLQFF